MDFWCSHPAQERVPPSHQWTDNDWWTAIVHLHPQLQGEKMRNELVNSVMYSKPFHISRFVAAPVLNPMQIEGTLAASLLPLWDSPQSMKVLVNRYQQIRPIHPITLEPIHLDGAFQTIKSLLSHLEKSLFVMIESKVNC